MLRDFDQTSLPFQCYNAILLFKNLSFLYSVACGLCLRQYLTIGNDSVPAGLCLEFNSAGKICCPWTLHTTKGDVINAIGV